MANQSSIDRFLESVTANKLVVAGALWLLVPSAIYCWTTPDEVSDSAKVGVGLVRSDGLGSVPGFPSALYFSAVTAATLGYGDIVPVGWVRVVACLQAIGGAVIAGIAVAAACNLSAKRTELLKRKLCGQWIEEVTHRKDGQQPEYVLMTVSVDELVGNVKFEERDFDYHSGHFKANYYNGELIANNYPEFIFKYTATERGVYNEGLESITIVHSSDSVDTEFRARCYDNIHGQFDDIRGIRVALPLSRRGAMPSPEVTAPEMKQLVDHYFGPPAGGVVRPDGTDGHEAGARQGTELSDAGGSHASRVGDARSRTAGRGDGSQSDSGDEHSIDYGLELILDLKNCDFGELSEAKFSVFFEVLCHKIGMRRHGDPKFWHDDVSDDKKIRGVSAIQFIETSNIVVHALPLMKSVHINVFSCKVFDVNVASLYAADYWRGTASQIRVVPRV